MEKNSASPAFRAFLPLLIVFVVTSILIYLADARLSAWHIDGLVVLSGNLIIFLATALSFYFYARSLQHNSAPVFLRMIYGGMFIKMMLLLIAAIIYISIAGKSVNKGAIFSCMFLYLLYTFIEIARLLKLSKQTQHNG
ncbi:MAG TPA: hypothetical protein VFS31_09955 [Chitinophagaceae bacterium]|nr:hypothetical protein [Chitinophagaceae bacterium]